ncbi:hypothetical protein EAP46_00005, partial [Salmonella enterica]|nr:hypothetical protein [Salmonella enterica]EAQ9957092.1 hypothetical protein [Salmonella enterica]EAS6318551.1 hypothetical protein [Salmonella enterica]
RSGSFPAIRVVTGRQRREISLLMKIFQGKSVSVLLLFNIMFYLILFKKRNDMPGCDFAIFMGFCVVPYFLRCDFYES